MCARARAIPSVWAHNTFLSTLSNVWCSQMLNIRQWNEFENIRTEHHSLSEYSMRARLSSPSTSPITLLAKSTRLPWRRISFQWITFISLIMHKVYLRHASTFTLSRSNTEGCQFPQIILSALIHSTITHWNRKETEWEWEYSGFTRSTPQYFPINGLKNVLIRIKSIKIYKYGESYVFALSLADGERHSII